MLLYASLSSFDYVFSGVIVSGSDRARHFNTLITVWLVLLCSLVSFIMQSG